jgi:hypothetical protein
MVDTRAIVRRAVGKCLGAPYGNDNAAKDHQSDEGLTPESLAASYGVTKVNVQEGASGEYSGGEITVGTDKTEGNYFAADWTSKGSPDMTSSKQYPANLRSAAHETAHAIFSKDPLKGQKALDQIRKLGVPSDVAFESLVDTGGLYILEPSAIKNPKVAEIMKSWIPIKKEKT